MAKIEDLEKELYGKEKENAEDIKKRAGWSVNLPRPLRKLPISWVGQDTEHHEPKPSNPYIKKLFIAVVILLFIVLGAVFVFLYLGSRGQEARMQIYSADTAEAGGVITIPIVFKNVSQSVLTEGEVAIILPKGALLRGGAQDVVPPPRIIKKVDNLQPGDQGTVEVSARLFGAKDDKQTIEAVYTYRPENLRARFTARTTKEVLITQVPLALSWEIPDTLSRGQDVELKVHYILNSRYPFPHMGLRLEYPPGFEFTSADPAPAVGREIWDLGQLDPGKEGVIAVLGKINGQEGEVKAFRGGLGSYNPLTKEWQYYMDSSKEIKIAVQPLSIQAFIESKRDVIVNPGDQIHIALRYKNNTPVTIRNLTIRARIESLIVRPDKIAIADGGVFDYTANSVVWGPGSTPLLREVAAGQEGELRVDVETADPPPVRTDTDKNIVVKITSSIESASIPDELLGTDLHSNDQVEFKVRSKILFAGKSLYKSSPIPNSGPLPPEVGQKTTYTIVWEVRNFTNDLDNVEITAALPPNIKWENIYNAQDSRIIYDASSGLARWHIGKVKAATGVLSPALAGAFQISVIPAEVDRGKQISLTKENTMTGTDMFTGERFTRKIPNLTTDLREDPGTSLQDWSVR